MLHCFNIDDESEGYTEKESKPENPMGKDEWINRLRVTFKAAAKEVGGLIPIVGDVVEVAGGKVEIKSYADMGEEYNPTPKFTTILDMNGSDGSKFLSVNPEQLAYVTLDVQIRGYWQVIVGFVKYPPVKEGSPEE